jgi:glycerol-3-phosphate O-acyltransferase
MSQTVAVPLWLLVILVALAAAAALEWLLLPSVRWYLRRKVDRVIREINVRFNIELPAFKLTRRRALIERLFHDPKVQAAAEAHAAEKNVPLKLARQRADYYAREIVPAFNAYLYFRVGYWLAKRSAQFLYRVRLGYTDADSLRAINPKSTVVFVMNHRSNMDYVLVAFLAAERVALSYAVGEWARVWPLQSLIRAMGAYFVHRNSGDPLYRTVLQRYVQMATEGGVPQAIYPEGGLTLDGRLRAPKLGLLDYMLRAFDPQAERDLVFIPVGINYDRVLEDRTQLGKLAAERERHGLAYVIATTAGFVGKQLANLLRGRWYRMGYACVNFGRPISMRDYVREQALDFRALDDATRHAAVAEVGAKLMHEIGEVVPVLPVPLVASVLLDAPRALDELELKSAVHELIARAEARGAHVYIPRSDLDYAIGVGLRMLTLRRLATERDALFSANPEERATLAYYANSIAHLIGEAGTATHPAGSRTAASPSAQSA